MNTSEHWRRWRAEEQVKKMTDAEIAKAVMPASRADFWLHNNLKIIWRLAHWNWFNFRTGEKGFFLFAKHGFREWKEGR